MSGIDDTVVLVGNGSEQDDLDSGVEAVWHSLGQEAKYVQLDLGDEKKNSLQRIFWIYLCFGLADHLTTVGVHGELKRQSVQVL